MTLRVTTAGAIVSEVIHVLMCAQCEAAVTVEAALIDGEAVPLSLPAGWRATAAPPEGADPLPRCAAWAVCADCRPSTAALRDAREHASP